MISWTLHIILKFINFFEICAVPLLIFFLLYIIIQDEGVH